MSKMSKENKDAGTFRDWRRSQEEAINMSNSKKKKKKK
jgi:hypothetical protein